MATFDLQGNMLPRALLRVLLAAGLAFFMVENEGVGWDSLNGLAVIAGGALFGLGWHWLRTIESPPDTGGDWDGDDGDED